MSVRGKEVGFAEDGLADLNKIHLTSLRVIFRSNAPKNSIEKWRVTNCSRYTAPESPRSVLELMIWVWGCILPMRQLTRSLKTSTKCFLTFRPLSEIEDNHRFTVDVVNEIEGWFWWDETGVHL